MRVLLAGAVTTAMGCPRQQLKEEPRRTRRLPPWGAGQLFFDSGELYAVASNDIPATPKSCPSAQGLVEKTLNEAAERLVEIAAPGQSPKILAHSGWFDGERRFFVVAKMATTSSIGVDAQIVSKAPKGGVPASALLNTARTAIRTRLTKSGFCTDPYQRPERTSCCGAVDELCEEATRFDRKTQDGRCSCGGDDPCLYDFFCIPRGGEVRCMCDGPRCPCEILNCKVGETCQNGRCF